MDKESFEENEVMMSGVKKVSNLIYCFQTFRKINIATFLYKKLSKSLFYKWIYYIIPVVTFFINILNLIRSKVLYSPHNEFTYLNDISNSLCLTLLYFFSYFLSGYYPSKLDKFICSGVDRNFVYELRNYSKDKKKSYILLIIIGIVLFGIAVITGYSFYNVAKSNMDAYWIYNLDSFGRIYYCLILGVTWYHSLSLLGMALSSGFIVYYVIEYRNLIYIEGDFNKNVSVMSAVDIVLSTFSYGLLYIIGSFLFIINDRVAEKYNVYNTFHEDIPSFILVLCITLLVVLAFLPLQELFVFMKVKKECFINSLNEMILKEKVDTRKEELRTKRNEIIKQNLIYTTITNKIIFVLSIFIPLIGVIFQGIDLFM